MRYLLIVWFVVGCIPNAGDRIPRKLTGLHCRTTLHTAVAVYRCSPTHCENEHCTWRMRYRCNYSLSNGEQHIRVLNVVPKVGDVVWHEREWRWYRGGWQHKSLAPTYIEYECVRRGEW